MNEITKDIKQITTGCLLQFLVAMFMHSWQSQESLDSSRYNQIEDTIGCRWHFCSAKIKKLFYASQSIESKCCRSGDESTNRKRRSIIYIDIISHGLALSFELSFSLYMTLI